MLPAARLPLPFSLLAVALSGCLVGACTTVRVDIPAAPTTPPAFEASATSPASQDVTRWWEAIGDPFLTQLVEQGLQSNADIRIAVERVKEARATVTLAESALFPTLDAVGAASRARIDNAAVGPFNPTLPVTPPIPLPRLPELTIPGNTQYASLAAGGLAATWEVDIFGSRRSDRDAARQAALGMQERQHGVQMLVAADIASNYFEARSIERRQQVLENSIAVAQRLQRYAQGRFDAGQATRFDVDRARTQLESIESMRAPLQSLLSARVRRLAVLTGRTPESLAKLPPQIPFPALSASLIPEQLPTVLPSDVLERRPDVRGTANLVRALAAKLGSAKADLLPKFYLGFLAQDGHIEISGLPSLNPNVMALSAGVRLPLFDAGRIRANIAASDARLQAAAIQYEQSILTALEDVENAYSARRALDERADKLSSAWKVAQDGAEHADHLFQEGSGLLQPVLEAKLQSLQREDELIQTQTARALTTVLLYKAIGGGWRAPDQDKAAAQ
ncbi:MAG: efflux transporter outer membrane subunit [Acidobacteriota bacterium]